MSGLSPLLTIMHRAAEKAGRGLTRDFGEVEQLQVSRKGPRDFVSSADLRAEETIIRELQRAYPDYGILSEEAGDIPGRDATRRWIIDPLDGTSNFLHSLPHFCTSIALVKQEGDEQELLAGLILNPLTQDLFTAEKGKGAMHNGRRMKVSSRKDPEEAILCVGSLAKRGGEQGERILRQFADTVYGIRCMGAAALDLAYMAAGKYDGFWQHGLKPWDMAAGVLMVQEAGGVVRNFRLQQDIWTDGQLLASNSQLAPRLDKMLAAVNKGA